MPASTSTPETTPLPEYRAAVERALDALRDLEAAQARAVEAIHDIGDSNRIPEGGYMLLRPIVNELEYLAEVVGDSDKAVEFSFSYIAESEEALRVLAEAAFERLEHAEAEKGGE